EERLPESLSEAAVKLPLGQERVDHGAGVIDPYEPLDHEPSRLCLDSHCARDGAEGPYLRLGLKVHRRLEAGCIPSRQRMAARIRRGSHVAPGDAPLRKTRDMEGARHAHHVWCRGFEKPGGDPASFLPHLDGDLAERAAPEHHASTAERAKTLGTRARVAV